jgi:hypothetical protein
MLLESLRNTGTMDKHYSSRFSPRASRSTRRFVVVVVVVVVLGTRLNFLRFFQSIKICCSFTLSKSLRVIKAHFKLFASGVECVCILLVLV